MRGAASTTGSVPGTAVDETGESVQVVAMPEATERPLAVSSRVPGFG
jgi:hypothetical protein